MLLSFVSRFNLLQSFNYAHYLFLQKTVQIRDQLFVYTDPSNHFCPSLGPNGGSMATDSGLRFRDGIPYWHGA